VTNRKKYSIDTSSSCSSCRRRRTSVKSTTSASPSASSTSSKFSRSSPKSWSKFKSSSTSSFTVSSLSSLLCVESRRAVTFGIDVVLALMLVNFFSSSLTIGLNTLGAYPKRSFVQVSSGSTFKYLARLERLAKDSLAYSAPPSLTKKVLSLTPVENVDVDECVVEKLLFRRFVVVRELPHSRIWPTAARSVRLP